jgi:hypothetical protein
VRTEQKSTEKKARDEANAAEKERRRAEKQEKTGGEPGRSRFLPGFLGRGGVAAGAGAGAAVAAGAEATADAVGGGAKTVAAAGVPGTSGAPATESVEPTGQTVHDKVTVDPTEPEAEEFAMDPTQAAHAVATAEAEDDVGDSAKPQETTRAPEDEVSPKDNVGAGLYAGTSPTEGITSPISPTTPASPSKRNSRVKSFFKRIRGSSKAENEYAPDSPATATATTESKDRMVDPAPTSDPIKEENADASDSIRDVAFAGRSDHETDDMYGGSAKPTGRVSPLHDDEAAPTSNAANTAGVGHAKERDVSPASDTSSLSEDPFVIAADVASSKYSTEHGTGSKRNSGYDQVAQLSDDDEEPRGRKGFRERFLKKVIPGRDKDKRQPGGFSSSAVGSSAAAQTNPAATPTVSQATAEDTTGAPQSRTEPETKESAPTEGIPPFTGDEESEIPRTKVQEPSTTSTEATGNTTVTGATTPALTHAQTNGDDDEDFEEARDTFDEGRIVSASKVDGGSARIVDASSPMSPVGSKSRTSGEGSRFTEAL